MEKIGSVAVIGAGIAGVQAALDLSESGYKVYLIEKTSSIGGAMAQLDKTFPTNDCSMCILSPKLVTAGRHPNIEVITMARIEQLKGEAGNFQLLLKKKSRYIDEEKCNGCGICAQECPIEAIDYFNEGLSINKAVSVPFPQSVPRYYLINKDKCIGCGICEAVCAVSAIDYKQEDKNIEINIGAIILSIGFDEFEPETLLPYGYNSYPNVITSIEFERILSASGPYSGMVLRPSDGKIPEKIAFLQCVGSRDCKHAKKYCSSVCCMYTAKEAVIAKEHQPQVNPSIFTMDIRAYGKDFDKYINRAQEEYGIKYIRSRIPSISEQSDSNDLFLTYEAENGKIIEEIFNMVVLSVGLNPPKDMKKLAEKFEIDLNEFGFCKSLPLSLEETTKSGIYMCGAISSPKDVPDSVVQASAAISNVNSLLYSTKGTMITKKEYPEEKDISGESPRIGVFICHCGINIGGVVNVPECVEYAKKLRDIEYVEQNLYTCSADTQDKIKEKILEHNLNRVVIASCTPRTHEPLFQETLREAGLNPYLYQMTNIRDQCSWVHMHEPKSATEKAKDLIHMAIERVRYHEKLKENILKITTKALVIGAGVSGLTASLNLATQGYKTYLVEKESKLGGFANKIHHTLEGIDIQNRLDSLINKVQNEKNLKYYTNSTIEDVSGYLGNFKSIIVTKNDNTKEKIEIDHGIIIVATGAKEIIPKEYLYSKDNRVLTQLELEDLIENQDFLQKDKIFVMIQCVGSRNEEHPYCSRVCCSEAIKNALKIKEKTPDSEIIVLYRDIRTYGFKEKFYRKAREKGIIFIRFEEKSKPQVSNVDNHLFVNVKKPNNDLIKIQTDFVVLSTGLEPPNEVESLSQMLKVPLNEDRFFLEAHVKLRPVDFATEGIFLCGTARAPSNIEESISQGKAAATRAQTILVKEVMKSSGVTAHVDENMCTGCQICIRICPYNAIEKDEEGVATVIEALCKGCGVCAASCPEMAINIQHFTRKEVISEIKALGGKIDAI